MTSPLQAHLLVTNASAYTLPLSPDSPLPALYADLSAQQSSNPAAFTSNVAWWGRTLSGALLAGALGNDRLVLSMRRDTKEVWENEEVGRPLGLGTAVLELARTESIVSLNTFLKASQPNSSTSLSSVATAPLRWLFAQLSLGGTANEGTSEEHDQRAVGEWVVLCNVERAANVLLAAHYAKPRLSPLDSLYSQSSLVKHLLHDLKDATGKSVDLSELDIKVLLKFLVRDNKVAQASGQVIKLAHTQGEQVTPITEQDRGVVQLRSTHAKLEDQVSDIERRIAEQTTRVQASLRSKQKPQAMSYLRSRKTLEELLVRRMGALETLHGVLIKLEQAAGDVEIMRAYELSTTTIRSLLAHPSLQREHVDTTMDNLADTLADHAEIAQAVQIGGQVAVGAAGDEIDEAELREEMERLEREAREEERDKENKVQLAVPATPNALPASSKAPEQRQQHSSENEQTPVAEQ